MLRIELMFAVAMSALIAATLGSIVEASGRPELDRALSEGEAMQERMAELPLSASEQPQPDHGKHLKQALDMTPAQQARARALLDTLARADRSWTGAMRRLPDPAPSQGRSAQRREHLVVFVSAGMPRASLKRLLEQARQADALVVWKGLVSGDFVAMARFMSELLGLDRDHPVSVRSIIDPRLFDRFGIKHVPVFAVSAPGICIGQCPDSRDSRAFLVAGDVTLGYALRHIRRAEPGLESVIEPYLQRLGSPS